MKCFLESLGCPKNLVDSEIMLGLLLKDGHEMTSSEKDAEIIIVNTCGFIESAREESIETILEMAQMKTDGCCKSLIVTGCLAQKYSKDLIKELPEVDAFIGTGEFDKINEVVKNLSSEKTIEIISAPDYSMNYTLPRIVTTPFYYAYLKISEGCNHKCSFCIIPELRGKYRSREIPLLVKEAKELAKRGAKELILIAQDTSQYGRDLSEKKNLVNLLYELEEIDGIEWIRIMYLYPASISDELLLFMKNSKKICHYIDLPVQHCEKEILYNMARGGDKESLLQLIKKIRTIMPDVTLRTSIIVGFPGEKEEHFESLLDFIEKAKFDRLGAFEYSKEEGTKAGKLKGKVNKKVKKERLHRVMMLQKEISKKKNSSLAGTILDVLIEQTDNLPEPYNAAGRSRRDAPDIDGYIYLADSGLMPGDLVKVKITGSEEYDLIGEIIE